MIDQVPTKWISCPDCGGNTRTKIRADATLYHHLIFCPKCKREYLINADHYKVTILQESDAKTQ